MTQSKAGATDVVVVDGSNIATEGRSTPSLAQLNDAVMAFRDEFPNAMVTVVVDATFGHRIDKRESAEFNAAVAHNELVAPPAGAIGRGDAFVLSIANKVGARVLSNDSFQEFHGEYPWLFEEGRLIGGKPVPYVGWVFVARLPVKGPTSRKATRAARDSAPSRRSASRAASQPMPVPTSPPPGARVKPMTAAAPPEVVEAPRGAGSAVNDLLPFLDFVEHHPIGSSVNGVVESYSSHGAYVSIGDVRGYVPLRMMSEPPPRSAREVMKVGDAVTLVVTSFAPARRSIDLAVPQMAPNADVVPSPPLDALAEAVVPARRSRKKAAAEPVPEPAAEPAAPAPAKRTRKKAAAPAVVTPAPTAPAEVAAEPAPASANRTRKKPAAPPAEAAPKTTTKKAAAKAAAPAKRATTRRAAAKKATSKRAAAEETS